MSDKAVELARDLLRELTNRDGWNEGSLEPLVYALADFIDPDDKYSVSGLVEGRDKS